MAPYSADWEHVKVGLGVVAYSALCAFLGYAFGRWPDASGGVHRGMWIMAAASLPWGLGILAAKIVFRSEEGGQATVANWHWGQIVIATVGALLLTATGLAGFVATLALLEQCTEAWQSVCRVGQWSYGVIAVLYALALALVLPFVLWWDAFAIRAHRAKLALETNLKDVFEAGRIKVAKGGGRN